MPSKEPIGEQQLSSYSLISSKNILMTIEAKWKHFQKNKTLDAYSPLLGMFKKVLHDEGK
jgi:hypothetical protein